MPSFTCFDIERAFRTPAKQLKVNSHIKLFILSAEAHFFEMNWLKHEQAQVTFGFKSLYKSIILFEFIVNPRAFEASM